MSLDAMTWCARRLPVEVSPCARLVLFVLAEAAWDHGDGTQQAWLPRSTIAERAGYSIRNAQRGLVELQEAGLIERGDQSLSGARRGNRRPVVWRLRTDRACPGFDAPTPAHCTRPHCTHYRGGRGVSRRMA